MEPTVYTVAEFCATHRISRSSLYMEWKKDSGPRVLRVGTKISHYTRGRGRLAPRARDAAGKADCGGLIGAPSKSDEARGWNSARASRV